MSETAVQHNRFRGGPHGIGDPEDKSLRKVEIDVLIPQKMRDIAKKEKCSPEVEAFTDCCKKSTYAMTFYCKKPNEDMKNCFKLWYEDEEFKERCRKEYLHERSEYRRTGISIAKLDSRRNRGNTQH